MTLPLIGLGPDTKGNHGRAGEWLPSVWAPGVSASSVRMPCKELKEPAREQSQEALPQNATNP